MTTSRSPRADRPQLPAGYGVPEQDEGLLAWDIVEDWLEKAQTYWVSTVRPEGRPHVSPIWGVWVDRSCWLEGSPATRRSQNLVANPEVTVHVSLLDDGPWEKVAIVEGRAESAVTPAPDLANRLVEAYAAKYEERFAYRPDPHQWDEGGLWRVQVRKVLAWNQFPTDLTRFTF